MEEIRLRTSSLFRLQWFSSVVSGGSPIGPRKKEKEGKNAISVWFVSSDTGV